MDLRVDVHCLVEAVASEPWDAVPGAGQGTLALDFLAPCGTALPGLAWRLLMARRGAECAGVAPGYVQQTEWTAVLSAFLARRLRPLRVLEVGPPVCPGPCAAVRDGGAWAALLDRARALLHEERLDVLAVRDFAGSVRTPEEEDLLARGFSVVTERDTYVLPLPFVDFAAYLATLRSDYRRRAQASLNLPLRVRVVRDFAGETELLARLIDVTTRRSTSSRAEHLDAALLSWWARVEDTAALFIDDEGGAVQAVAVVLCDGPVVHFLRCGFDAAVGRASGAYLRLLFELVRFALEQGAEYLDLGVTSAEPKLRLGAQPVPLRVWAYPRHPLLRRALRLVSPALASSRPKESRHVFREPQPHVNPWWFRPLPVAAG